MVKTPFLADLTSDFIYRKDGKENFDFFTANACYLLAGGEIGTKGGRSYISTVLFAYDIH